MSRRKAKDDNFLIEDDIVDESSYYIDDGDVDDLLNWDEDAIIKKFSISEDDNASSIDFSDSKSSFIMYLQEIGRIPLLEPEEERYLFEHKDEGNNRNKLINANLRLVVNVAMKYSYSGSSVEDMITEGNLGLMHAVDMFDVNKGNKFSTYAIYWIKREISKFVHVGEPMIRIPIQQAYRLSKIKSFKRDYNMVFGSEPDDVMVEQECDLKSGSLEKFLMNYDYNYASLDTPIGEVGNITLGDAIPSPYEETPEVIYEKKTLRPLIEEVMDSVLKEREKKILKLRFGFDNGETMTLAEVGNVMNTHGESIRQTERNALKKLKNAKNLKLLEDYILLEKQVVSF